MATAGAKAWELEAGRRALLPLAASGATPATDAAAEAETVEVYLLCLAAGLRLSSAVVETWSSAANKSAMTTAHTVVGNVTSALYRTKNWGAVIC